MSGLTKDELKKQGRERADRALQYRKHGLTYKWICKEMNISYTRARQLVEIAERNCSVMTDEGQRMRLTFDAEVIEMVKEAVEMEREACANVAAWILKMPENDVSAAIRARGQG